jgi:hypothetical protein
VKLTVYYSDDFRASCRGAPYTGWPLTKVAVFSDVTTEDYAEAAFARLNYGDGSGPAGSYGTSDWYSTVDFLGKTENEIRSLSVGDVVVLSGDEGERTTAFLCDSFGWTCVALDELVVKPLDAGSVESLG